MKARLTLISMVLLILSGCANSHPITGYWVGSMEMNGKTVDISIVFNSESSSFSSHDLMLLQEPVRNLKYGNKDVSFSIALDPDMIFKGITENERMSGTLNIQGGPPNMKMGFNLAKKSETPPAKSYSIEKLRIKSKGADLAAEIYVPQSKGLHPALVLLHGSSTNLKTQYGFYADFFASLGFEVLLFDKRGNGESTGNYATASYGSLADDAIACLEILKNRDGVDKNKIGLWGYSQGAMLLPFIVTKTDLPAFLIAKSAEVVSVTEAGAYADGLRVIRSGHSPAEARIAAESHRKVEKMIRDGSGYKDVEAFIRQNARKYVFMNQTGLQGDLMINKNDFEGYYWKGRAENFYSFWRKIKIPTLVLFGENDEFVDAVRNEAMLKNLHNEKIETKIFPRANHSLKKTSDPAKYPDFDWPRIIDGYLEFVQIWINKAVGK